MRLRLRLVHIFERRLTHLTLSKSIHKKLARELHEAEMPRVQIEQFSRRCPDMTLDDSYAIQREWMKLKGESRRRPIGRKIGLTSRAMQIASQINEPDHGVLLDDMLVNDGSEILASRFIVPRLEVEFAIVLRHALKGPGVTIFDDLRWCGALVRPVHTSGDCALPCAPREDQASLAHRIETRNIC